MAGLGLLRIVHARRISDARRHARLDLWSDAAKYYEGALELYPHLASTWLQLGHCRKHLGAYHEAKQAYLRAIALAPTDFESNRQLGFFLRTEGQDHEAARYFAAANFLDPNDGEIDQILRYSGIPPQTREKLALDTFKTASSHRGNGAITYLNQLACTFYRSQARRAARKNMWADATQHYHALLGRNPADHAAWLQLGHVERARGNLPEAEHAYRRAVAGKPWDAEFLLQLGYLLKDRGEAASAIFYLQQCLQISPAHVAATQGLKELGASSTLPDAGSPAGEMEGSHSATVGAVPINWSSTTHSIPPPLRLAPHLTPVTQAEFNKFMLTVRRLTKEDITSQQP